MSSIQNVHARGVAGRAPGALAEESAAGAGGGALLVLLATTAGLSVASLYYSQPMLGVLGPDMQADSRVVGLVPTLTQLGYALGILLLAPLGDRFDRRRIIVIKSIAVMTGLLLGILLSRVVSGFVAQQWGWRTVYVAAAVAIALLTVAVWRGLQRFAPTTQMGYGALIGYMGALWRQHAALRRAAWAQGLLAVGFSAFWSTLAVMLHSQFQLGTAAAGAFGPAVQPMHPQHPPAQ